MAFKNIAQQLALRQIGQPTDIPGRIFEEWTSKIVPKQFIFSTYIYRANAIRCLNLDANGEFLVAGFWRGTLSLYRADTEGEIQSNNFEHITDIAAFSNRGSFESVKWFPSTQGMFAAGGVYKKLIIFDCEGMMTVERITFRNIITQIAMSSLGGVSNGLISVSEYRGKTKLVDMKSGHSIQELKWLDVGSTCCAWSTTSEYLLAAGGSSSKVNIWDIRSCRNPLVMFTIPDHMGQGSEISGVIFSSDGNRLVTACKSHISSWDTRLGTMLSTKYDEIQNIRTKAINFDVAQFGNLEICIVPSGNNIVIYNLKTGKTITKLTGHVRLCNGVNYNMRKKELYSVGDDSILIRWVYKHDKGNE